MSEDLLPLARPAAGRLNLRRMALLAAVVAPLLLLLWWIDPRRVSVPMCGFYVSTGLHCPGCGATRATHELLHGRLLSAMSYNALWVLALPPVVYAALSESLHFVCGRRLPGDLARRPWFYVALAVLAAVFGVLRNLPWEPFVQWAPPG